MRGYFWVNYYLSDIQRGIQTAHALGELCNKYTDRDGVEEDLYLYSWLNEHKTIIVLNGGNQASLKSIIGGIEYLEAQGIFQFPWAYFQEDMESLNNAVTCFGVILPEIVYQYQNAAELPSGYMYNEQENYFIELLAKAHLA